MTENGDLVLGRIDEATSAYTHVPEHGFSLFLANRTKTIHFVRHAEGRHNAANQKAGDDSPVTHSTPGAWDYEDAKLTDKGIQQCIQAKKELLTDVHPELIIVSPFTRTLQTAHIMFGGKGVPFMVHDLCRERSGKFTCDKRRTKTEIVKELQPLFDSTQDVIDFDRFGYPEEEDQTWTPEREPSEQVTGRGIACMQWLASRPEQEMVVVTHSSWLKHLFRAFGRHVEDKDTEKLHRLAGNAEVRSISLALHRGFYPEGVWQEDDFTPDDHSFRRGRWAPSDSQIARMHGNVRTSSLLTSQESMPHVE
jgi:broad specificity phosphatase PhoE